MRWVLFVFLFVMALVSGTVSWAVLTPWGARFLIHQATERLFGPGRIIWERLEGSLVQGLTVRNLEVHNPGVFPVGSEIRVQTLSVRLRGFSGVSDLSVSVDNARLMPPGRDNIVLRGRLEGGVVSANIYAHSLELGDVRDILIRYFHLVLFKGSCEDIDLVINGRIDHLDVTGTFLVDRIVQNEFVLNKVPVKAAVSFVRGNSRWQTLGRLNLQSGWLYNPLLRVVLKPSRLIFSGRLSRPELDIQASTRVARTTIDIVVKGTRQAPDLTLTSDPPYPKEELLMMLATGKRWSGMEKSAGNSKTSPELASNFVDYLLFGGTRSNFIRAVGLSDISVVADQRKQGLSVSKDLTDRLGIGYGVEFDTDTQRQRELTQRLESEYRLTNKLTVGAQKELKGAKDEIGQTVDPQSAPDDRVYMKYKTAF